MIDIKKVAHKAEWKVTLDKKVVGKIVLGDLQYQYIPKAGLAFAGEKFDKLDDCIRSLKS